MTRGGFALLVATAMAATLASGDVHAAPLDAQGCAKLKDERAVLEQAGVRGTMAKGPEWAKTNLPPDKLEQVRRLIDVDAQLTFRCHGKPLVQLPPEIEADPAAGPAADDAKGKAVPAKGGKAPSAEKRSAVKKAAVQPPDKSASEPGKQEPAAKKASPAGKAAAAKQAVEGSGQPAANAPVKAKAKPKPKANDAYRPTVGDPTASPFSSQAK